MTAAMATTSPAFARPRSCSCRSTRTRRRRSSSACRRRRSRRSAARSRRSARSRSTPRKDVFGEFYNLALANTLPHRGRPGVRQDAAPQSRSSEDDAERVDQAGHAAGRRPRRSRSCRRPRAENLLTFIQDEHPQTIALILAHLPPQKASAKSSSACPSQKQIEVVKRIANMEQTNPEVIKEVERGLEHRLSRHRQPDLRKGRRRGHGGRDPQPRRPLDGEGDHGRPGGRGPGPGRADPPAHVRLRGHPAGQRQGHPVGAQGDRQRGAVAWR